MYEFKYPNIANLSAKEIKESILFLTTSLQNRVNNASGKISEFEAEILRKNINYVRDNFNVTINMREQRENPIDYKIINKMIDDSKKMGLPLHIYIMGNTVDGKTKDAVPMLFSQDAIDNLIDLNNYLLDNKCDGIKFLEDPSYPEYAWTIQEVMRANSEIDALVDYIKEQKFTQFETVAFIHQYIASLYQYQEDKTNLSISRSIVGVLNSDKIVCVGYAYLTKAIIDKLDMPGLACSTFISRFSPKEKTTKKDIVPMTGIEMFDDNSLHMQNLIKINDPKYKVQGAYISDVCGDSKTKITPSGKGFSNMMFPVEDLLHYKYYNFDQTDPVVDQMFKTLGVKPKLDPYTNPIIAENINNSKPIDFNTYKSCFINLFKKMNPKESETSIKDKVENLFIISQLYAYELFDDNAIGSISQNARTSFIEDLKAVGIQME